MREFRTTEVVPANAVDGRMTRTPPFEEKQMRSSRLVTVFAALVIMTACASKEEQGGMGNESDMKGTEMAAASATVTGESVGDRTERRLQLERALDQWVTAFSRQEYSQADGVASALEGYVNKNFDEVVADLATASPRFRRTAAAALGFSARREAVPHLIEALRDPFAPVVNGALVSLWRLALMEDGADIPVAEVIPFLAHADPEIRSNAALVLAQATKPGQGELFLPLTAAMEDVDASVRVHAAAALGALGDADAIPFLAKGLKDSKALVRIRSAYALGRIGDKRAVEPLIERLDDPEEDVTKAAHKALTTITGQKIGRHRADWEDYNRNIGQ